MQWIVESDQRPTPSLFWIPLVVPSPSIPLLAFLNGYIYPPGWSCLHSFSDTHTHTHTHTKCTSDDMEQRHIRQSNMVLAQVTIILDSVKVWIHFYPNFPSWNTRNSLRSSWMVRDLWILTHGEVLPCINNKKIKNVRHSVTSILKRRSLITLLRI